MVARRTCVHLLLGEHQNHNWMLNNHQQEDAGNTPPKEDTPCPKRRKKPQRDRRRSTITIKSSHMPARWVTCTVEHSSTKEVLLLWEDRIMLPSLGVWQRDWEFPGSLTLKANGILLQDFHRTRGSRDSTRRGHKQNPVCIGCPGERSSDSPGDWTRPPC